MEQDPTAGASRDIVQSVKQLQESLCGECEVEVAVVDCEDCHESYCKTCCEMVHKKGRRKTHTKFIKIQICGQCEVVAATKECLDCKEFYCAPCCEEVHSKGQRVKHKAIQQIDTTKFRAVNYDQTNAFGLVTKQLRFGRFATPDADYNDRVDKHSSLYCSIAADCRTEEKPFVDTAPATLHEPELGRPQQISSQIQSDEVMKEMEVELMLEEEARQKKMAAVSCILSDVYSWRRPRQFSEHPSLFSDGNTLLAAWPPGTEAPVASISYLPMFRQGLLCDYHFLLALSAVASRRNLLSNLFVSCSNSDVGMYTLQFYKSEEMGSVGWHPVSIDNLIPCGKQRDPVFGATDDPDELWVMLVEKAYAKFLGAYSHLHYGSTSRALRHLTGGEPTVDVWRRGTLSANSKRKLWWMLSQASAQGMLVVCMRRTEGRETLKGVFTSEGSSLALQDDTITECKEELSWESGEVVQLTYDITVGQREKKQHRLIKLRNVHGEQTWNGDWSDASALWTKEMRDLLNHKQVDDHITWMDIEDFAERFDTMCVLSTHRAVHDALHPCPAPAEAFQRRVPEGGSYGTLPCFADQYYIEVRNPILDEEREGAETGDAGDVTPDALYSTPDWKAEAEADAEGAGANEEEGRLVSRRDVKVKVTLTQPALVDNRGNQLDPIGYEVLLFRLQEKGLQKPGVPDGTEGEASLSPKQVGKTDVQWLFPIHNQVPVKTVPQVKVPASAAMSSGYTTVDNSNSPYVRNVELTLHPGHYSLAIVKTCPHDALDYSASFLVQGDGTNAAGIETSFSAMGSVLNPEFEAADTKPARTLVSPRLMIQAQRQQQALA